MGKTRTDKSTAGSLSVEPAPSNRSTIQITVYHHGDPHHFSLASGSTLQALSAAIATTLSIRPENQKLIIPQLGLKKAPVLAIPLSSLPLSSPRSKSTLIGSTTSEIEPSKNR